MEEFNTDEIKTEKPGTTQAKIFDDNTTVEKELVSRYMDKVDLENKTLEITISDVGQNKHGRYVLEFFYEGVKRNLAMSKVNKNELLELFGPRIKDWKGQTIKVTGRHFVPDNTKGGEISEGTVLEISRA